MKYNVPLLLTLIRLIVSPILLPVLLVYLLPYNNLWLNMSLAALFVCFGLTDFFDGYLARKLHQETLIGRILDPIADKFLVYSVLIALLAASKINFFWVVLLIGREFFMMGLRHVALEHHMIVPVRLWGKLKTSAQIAYLTVVIANPYHAAGLFVGRWNQLEMLLLLITLVLSLGSAAHYYSYFMVEYEKRKSIKTSVEIEDEDQ